MTEAIIHRIKICVFIISILTFLAMFVLFCFNLNDFLDYKHTIDAISNDINTQKELLRSARIELSCTFFCMLVSLLLSGLTFTSLYNFHVKEEPPTNSPDVRCISQNNSTSPIIKDQPKIEDTPGMEQLVENNILFYENEIESLKNLRTNQNNVNIDNQLQFLTKQLEYWKAKTPKSEKTTVPSSLVEENISFYKKEIELVQKLRNDKNSEEIDSKLNFLTQELKNWESKKLP